MASSYTDYKKNIGALDQKVTLLSPTVSRDIMGSPVTVWHPIFDAAAYVAPLSGRERFNLSQSMPEASVKVIIRYRSGILPGVHIRHELPDRVSRYELIGPPIDEEQKHEFIEMLCKEIL